jgi:hypothetical protein
MIGFESMVPFCFNIFLQEKGILLIVGSSAALTLAGREKIMEFLYCIRKSPIKTTSVGIPQNNLNY